MGHSKTIALALACSTAIGVVAPDVAFAAKASRAAPPPDPVAMRQQALAAAPDLFRQAGVFCSASDAAVLRTTKGPGGETKVYEFACNNSLGYIVTAPAQGAASAYDCLAMSENKQPGADYCSLAANRDPSAALKPLVAQAGADCSPIRSRWIGVSTADRVDQYEVGCSSGRAFVLVSPRPGSTRALSAVDCQTLEPGKCTFFSREQYLARISTMAAPAKRNCQVVNARYVGTDARSKNTYFEVGCAEPKAGFMLQVDPQEHYVSAIDCSRAASVDRCQLNSALAQQAQASRPAVVQAPQQTGPVTATTQGVQPVSYARIAAAPTVYNQPDSARREAHRHDTGNKIKGCLVGAAIGTALGFMLASRDNRGGAMIAGAAAGCVAGFAFAANWSEKDKAALDAQTQDVLDQQQSANSQSTWTAPESRQQVTFTASDPETVTQKVDFDHYDYVAPPEQGARVIARPYKTTGVVALRSSQKADSEDNVVAVYNRGDTVEVIGASPDGRWAMIGDDGVIAGYASFDSLVAMDTHQSLRHTPTAKPKSVKTMQANNAAPAAPPQVKTVKVMASTQCKSVVAVSGAQTDRKKGCLSTGGDWKVA